MENTEKKIKNESVISRRRVGGHICSRLKKKKKSISAELTESAWSLFRPIIVKRSCQQTEKHGITTVRSEMMKVLICLWALSLRMYGRRRSHTEEEEESWSEEVQRRHLTSHLSKRGGRERCPWRR